MFFTITLFRAHEIDCYILYHSVRKIHQQFHHDLTYLNLLQDNFLLLKVKQSFMLMLYLTKKGKNIYAVMDQF